MLFLARTVIAFALTLAVAVVALALLVFEKQPLVTSSSQLAPADLARVKGILEEHDPSQMKAGAIRTLTLSNGELTLVTNYLLNYYLGRGVAEVQLRGATLLVQASLQVPDHRWGYSLNLRATWVQRGGSLRVGVVHVGGLPVPGWLAERVFRKTLRLLDENIPADLIQSIGISRGMLRVTYQWQPEMLETVRRRVIPKAEASRLKLFHAELVRLAAQHANSKRVSMVSFLRGLFNFASTRLGENPVADNRAILMVLGAYVNGRGLAALVPEARAWSKPKQLTLTLAGRKDLALHFLTSAMLAVTGGGLLSDTMGVYKEMADAQKGSGFSFSDLAADRAGTRFSELATRSPASAKKVWQAFSGPVGESAFMPSVKNLPEFMSEAAFRQRFGAVASPAYKRVVQDIEERISAASLYRQR